MRFQFKNQLPQWWPFIFKNLISNCVFSSWWTRTGVFLKILVLFCGTRLINITLMLLTDLAVKLGRHWKWWIMLCLHWWLIIVTGSECVETHFRACCKQAGVQTVSQEAVEHFCMDLSWQEEKARQQCKKIANGLCARKNILFY